MAEKKVVYKVYDKNGTYIKTWSDVSQSPPQFRWEINGGVSELTIRLSRKTNALNEGQDLWLGNKVEVIVFDIDNPAPDGKAIYSGWIKDYSAQIGKAEEEVEVRLVGWFSRLFKLILKDSSGNFQINYLSYDPSDILKDILDKAKSQVTYSATSIESTGTVVTYQFSHETVGEALQKVIDLSPYNWFFYISPSNILYFKKADVKVIDHRLTMGKHIGAASVEKSLDNMVNYVLFKGGTDDWDVPLVTTMSGQSSLKEFGEFADKVVDRRVTLSGTASKFMEARLGFLAGPRLRATVEVLDNNGEQAGKGYDIESFSPGQVVKIMEPEKQGKIESLWGGESTWGITRWGWDIQQLFGMRWRIMSIDYQFHKCVLTLSTQREDFAKRIEDVVRNLERELSYEDEVSRQIVLGDEDDVDRMIIGEQ